MPGRVVRGTLLPLLLAVAWPHRATAQPRPARPAASAAATATPDPAARQALDRWLVVHVRGVQLLPDGSDDRPASAPAADAMAPPVRIEGTSDGRREDSLFAVHYAADASAAALPVGAPAALSTPTGALVGVSATVVARRAFRAPRRPAAATDRPEQWRHGWAYLATTTDVAGTVQAAGRLGWLLVPLPVSAPARPQPRPQPRPSTGAPPRS
jgi:hypothetical protein